MAGHKLAHTLLDIPLRLRASVYLYTYQQCPTTLIYILMSINYHPSAYFGFSGYFVVAARI